MTFTDNFAIQAGTAPTGGIGQTLANRPGWSLAFGQDCLTINSSGQLTKAGTTTSALNAYYVADDGSIAQRVVISQAGAGASSIGGILMASGTSEATFNGYWFRPQTSGSGARMYRINNGVIEGSPALTVATTGTATALEGRATVSGGNTVLEIWVGGVQAGTFTDSTANKKTSGRRGILTNSTASINPALSSFADNSVAAAALAINVPLCPFYEGLRGASLMPVSGTYTSATSIEARLMNVDSSGNPTTVVTGFDWSTKVASPTGGAFTTNFTGVPVGGPYRVQVRDSAVPGTVVTGTADRHVGAIVFAWGQSQCERLFTLGVGSVAPTAGLKAFQLRQVDQTQPGTPTFTSMLATPAVIGSGAMSLANQWMADTGNIPLLLVKCNYEGTSIDQWISDTGQRPSQVSGYYLWPGLATTMLNATANQASAVMFMQGTADVGTYTTYAARMETLRGKFAALLPGQNPLYTVVPHQRSNDTAQTWNMRNAQYGKAISGDPWRLCAWLLDWQMDSDASPHQADNAAGNPRGGRRIGRGLAKTLVNPALDMAGPQIVNVDFVDATRMGIDVTFDRDIKTAGGTATTGLPGHFVSSNNGSSFAEPPIGYTVATNGARAVRVTSTGAAFPLGATRYDLLRGIPFWSDSTAPGYVGPEADMETNFLSKVITDTTSFDGGRGMPASPVMGTGLPVALPIPIVATNATGSATLRVRQPA